MKLRRLKSFLSFCVLALTLTGCGGSDNHGSVTTVDPVAQNMAPRAYQATASAGDFVQFELDPTDLSYDYQNLTTGHVEAGTYQYGAAGELVFTPGDNTTSKLLSGYETPGIGLVLFANETGKTADKTSIIFGVPKSQLTVEEFTSSYKSKTFNLLNYRLSDGGFDFGEALFDENAFVSSTSYGPLSNRIEGLNNINFLANTVNSEDLTHLIFSTTEDIGNGPEIFENYIFKTADDSTLAVDNQFGSMLLVESQATPNFQSEWAGSYSLVLYETHGNRTSGDVPGIFSRGEIVVDSDGQCSIIKYHDGEHIAYVGRAQLSPLNENASALLRLPPGTPYPGQNNGAFYWQDPASARELFVVFGKDSIFLGVTQVTEEDPGSLDNGIPAVISYSYSYGIGIKPYPSNFDTDTVATVDSLAVNTQDPQGIYRVGDNLEFSSTVSPGDFDVEGILWDFGDGTNEYSLVADPALPVHHIYSNSGNYVVSARLRSTEGFWGPGELLMDSNGNITTLDISEETPPEIVSFVATADPDHLQGVTAGDKVTIRFNNITDRADFTYGNILSKAEVDAMFLFSESLGADYSGSWLGQNDIFVITIIDPTGAEALVGTTTVTTDFPKTSGYGEIRTYLGSPASNSTSPSLAGSFGDITPILTPPAVTSVDFSPRAAGDNGVDAYVNQSVTFSWDKPLDEGLDPILGYFFTVSLDGIPVAKKFIPETGNSPISYNYNFNEAGSYIVSVTSMNSELISDPTSPQNQSGFDETVDVQASIMPKIDLYQAVNTGSNYVYELGDNIIISFDSPTNMGGFAQGDMLSKAEVDNLVQFSSSIGIDYEGQWTSPQLLSIRILEPNNFFLTPRIGVDWVTPRKSSLSASETIPGYVDTTPMTLTGHW